MVTFLLNVSVIIIIIVIIVIIIIIIIIIVIVTSRILVTFLLNVSVKLNGRSFGPTLHVVFFIFAPILRRKN